MNVIVKHVAPCAIACLISCLSNANTQQGLPYIQNMVHNNPGEQPFVTKYNDGHFLKSEGFNGVVPQWHVNCAITYDNYKKGTVKKGTKERKWIETHAQEVQLKLDSLKAEGLDVYPFTDFLIFPKSVWDKYGDELRGGKIGDKTKSNKPDLQAKRTQDLLRSQIEGIFETFPKLDGLTLRFGETYLHDTPYHSGNSPIRDKEAIADHVLFINILREEVCVKRNKKLFYRTWDFGYKFHNNPDFYLAVTNQIEPHPNLIFSIKYQQGDFHRNCPFNPSIGKGKHPQIVESQSQMEAYGKGAHPYYTALGVIEGWPETKYEIDWEKSRLTDKLRDPSTPRGLKDVVNGGIIKGVVTWARGGGWQGPYLTNELWIDLNTFVVSQWAQRPESTEEELFFDFTKKIGLNEVNARRFRKIALLSIEGVRKGHLNSYTQNNVWWTRDEFFSAAANETTLKEIFQKKLQAKVLAEKEEAEAAWLQIEAISKQMDAEDKDLLEAIRISCTYGRIKYQLIHQMWILMIENFSYQSGFGENQALVKEAVRRYDELWSEWKALKESSRFCATLYTDMAFRNNRKGSIGEMVNVIRERIK